MDISNSELQAIQSYFPNLKRQSFRITSPQDMGYNCIGWAINDNSRWWWPDSSYYWPTADNQATAENFLNVFQSLGYKRCTNKDTRRGYKKIALYINASSNKITHVARQLANGLWTSKLGVEYDIEHAKPEDLEGLNYGEVFCYMERKSKDNK